MLANVNVKRRIAELRMAAAMDAQASLSTLVAVLDAKARAEIAAGEFRPALRLLQRLEQIATGRPLHPARLRCSLCVRLAV